MAPVQTHHAEASRRSRVELLAAQLYRDHGGRLLNIAIRNAANRSDAEEALQDSLAIFLRAFDPDDEAPPLAWLTLTLKRSCWAAYRRQHLDRSAGQEAASASDEPGLSLASIASEGPDAQDAIERAERTLDVRERLAALKPDQRHALSLLALGYSYNEIGRLTGWTYTKINRSIAEGRTALRANPGG